jgi:hypothetical protein
VKSTPEVRCRFSLYFPKKFGKKDQFISMYFFGTLSSFPNITVKTIPRAEEKAKGNIKILSRRKVHHSMIISSYDSLTGVL